MTKREEIREGIAETLYRFEYDGWDRLDAGGRVMWLARADAVMNKEHSQGVVLKVDRELHIFTPDGERTARLVKQAGFEATEPLIKEEVKGD